MAQRDKVKHIFETWRALNPHPTTELDYGNAFQLLVAVVLSAQATDISVNKATKPLFEKIKTPDDMVALGEEKLLEAIRSIGLYRAKGKNVLRLSSLLIENFGGEVPTTREELELLPGVGRKTANVVLNTLYGMPVIAVDTHVFRVSNRLGIAIGATPLEVELGLEKNVPQEFKRDAHHWLILHGRYVCTAKKPACDRCPVSKWCDFYSDSQCINTIENHYNKDC